VNLTWESIQLFSLISKFIVLSELFRQPTYGKQDVIGKTFDQMLVRFRRRVCLLYEEWHLSLQGFLNSNDDAFFEAIRLNTAPVDDFEDSLYLLSVFLARRFGKKVIVLMDEYDAPITFAYKYDFFSQVRPSHYSRLWSRLRVAI
jgi:hypothetical protein